VTFAVEHETRREATGPAFSDAVTFAFADPARELYGSARLGIADGRASALAVLMRGREPLGALAEGGLEVPDGAEWVDFGAAGLRTTVEAPLETWAVAYDGADHGFALTFTAISTPGALSPVVGMEGYEQLCAVRGTVRVGTETIELEGLGQRGHSWGAPDWDAIALTRAVSAWLGDGQLGGITLAAARPAGASAHADELVRAVLVEEGEAIDVFDPRISTTYDGDGHTRRVGLELWVTEDGYPLRAAGEVLCGTSLDLGALSLDLAFLRWHAEGHEGVGRYEILRRR
jgi:hypothetical protein